jgi:hypothetical protein
MRAYVPGGVVAGAPGAVTVQWGHGMRATRCLTGFVLVVQGLVVGCWRWDAARSENVLTSTHIFSSCAACMIDRHRH